jgi:fermentation-respiration switch protein FrsA (DUF1100 family)
MRKNVKFPSKELRCSAYYYVPDNIKIGQKLPAIIMAHGLTGVKEHTLPDFAERFVAAGFVVLLFDYRTFGDSEGEPRCQLFQLELAEDYRNAITWMSEQPEVDPNRIGIWGTSNSGGLVLYVATFDSRVKAVVAQEPAVFNPAAWHTIDPEKWLKDGESILDDRIRRYHDKTVKYVKVVAPEGEPCVLPGKEAYEYFMATRKTAPNWCNQITSESLEKMREFDPVSFVDLIPGIPVLFIPMENDGLIPMEITMQVYNRIPEPKKIIILPIRHFDVYFKPWMPKAADAAIEWYKKYL